MPYLLDACQSVGQMPVDVEAIGCDMLSATGRKYLRGPRGTGFLYVRRERARAARAAVPRPARRRRGWRRDRYVIRPDARRFENWETNFAGKLGLGVAVDYALRLGPGRHLGARPVARRRPARAARREMPGVTVHDIGAERCGIVTFTVDGHEPAAVQRALARAAINVSVAPRDVRALDMEARGLDEVVRASVHYYNTEDEIERLLEVVARLAPLRRRARAPARTA